MFLTTCLRQIVGRWISLDELQLIIDTAFTTEVESPDDWVAFPARLAPVLDA